MDHKTGKQFDSGYQGSANPDYVHNNIKQENQDREERSGISNNSQGIKILHKLGACLKPCDYHVSRISLGAKEGDLSAAYYRHTAPEPHGKTKQNSELVTKQKFVLKTTVKTNRNDLINHSKHQGATTRESATVRVIGGEKTTRSHRGCTTDERGGGGGRMNREKAKTLPLHKKSSDDAKIYHGDIDMIPTKLERTSKSLSTKGVTVTSSQRGGLKKTRLSRSTHNLFMNKLEDVDIEMTDVEGASSKSGMTRASSCDDIPHSPLSVSSQETKRSTIITPPMLHKPRLPVPDGRSLLIDAAVRRSHAHRGGVEVVDDGDGSLGRVSEWVKRQRTIALPPQVAEEEDMQRKKPKQLQAYVAWVNSQLKKKPGTRSVEDLRDMQDGVALADLIEIVANEQLQGIYGAPSSAIEMISNVDKVLQFMTSHRIRMHHTTAPDIVEGNLKSIMRLILALAAHYKPKSVKHSSQQPQAGALSPRSHPTLIGLAQGAAAAIADARRDASIVHQRPQRPRYLSQDNRFQGSGSESEAGAADPERGEQLQVLRYRERGELEGASCGSSPRSSVPGSPKANRRLNFGDPKSPSQELDPGHHRDEEVHDACDGEADVWHELSEEHNGLVQDMVVTKRALLQLQKLLLSGQPPDGQEDPESKACEGATSDEQLVILKSQLQQTEELCRDLREELSKVKNDAMQLQGTKAGLQKRLAEQDEAFLKMKAELLRIGFSQQSLSTEKADLEKKVLDQDRLIHDLRRELQHRDCQIEELVASLQFQQQDKDMTTRALHTQIVDLHEKLQMVGETEASLSQRVASQDRKMALLEGKLLHTQFDSPSRPSSARSHQSGNSDDLQAMRDSLQSLRTSFAGNDPTHHTIDTLERSISGLMERLQMSEASRLSDSLNMSSRHHYNYDSTGDIRRSPISSLHMQGVNRLDSSSGSNNSNSSTKVLYFTDRAVTPFMCSIQKRLGEICLRDFKEMYDRHGNYRYHFKAMDPEFGTVKEEITNDDDIIPGWEGKIVAWIEEDHG